MNLPCGIRGKTCWVHSGPENVIRVLNQRTNEILRVLKLRIAIILIHILKDLGIFRVKNHHALKSCRYGNAVSRQFIALHR